MPPATPGFDRFIAAIHRRSAAAALSRAIAIGLAVGAAIGLLLMGLEVWRGLAISAPTGLIAAASILGGSAWGWLNRPATIASALTADRQLATGELFSTVLMVRSSSAADSQLLHALRELAEIRSLPLRGSAIRFRRIGWRVWSGVILCWALLLSLSIGNAGISRTDPAPSGQSPNLIATAQMQSPGVDLSPPSASSPIVHLDPEDPAASKFGQVEHTQDAGDRPNSDANYDPSVNSGSANANGRGESHTRSGAPPNGNRDEAPGKEHSQAVDENSKQSSGSGLASKGSPGDGQPAGSAVTGGTASPPVAPWESPSWPAKIDRAQHIAASGQIPSSYRDLIRAYFQ